MINIKNYVILVIIAIIFSCEKKTDNNLYIYVMNESNIADTIDIDIYINDSMYIHDKFIPNKISNVAKAFNYKLKKNAYNIKVVASKDSLITERHFDLIEKKYIMIIASHTVINNYKRYEPAYKDSTSLCLKKNGIDSVVIDKNLSIGIEDKDIYSK